MAARFHLPLASHVTLTMMTTRAWPRVHHIHDECMWLSLALLVSSTHPQLLMRARGQSNGGFGAVGRAIALPIVVGSRFALHISSTWRLSQWVSSFETTGARRNPQVATLHYSIRLPPTPRTLQQGAHRNSLRGHREYCHPCLLTMLRPPHPKAPPRYHSFRSQRRSGARSVRAASTGGDAGSEAGRRMRQRQGRGGSAWTATPTI